MPFNGLEPEDLPEPDAGEALEGPPAPVSGNGEEQTGENGEPAPAPPQRPARQPPAANGDRAA